MTNVPPKLLCTQQRAKCNSQFSKANRNCNVLKNSLKGRDKQDTLCMSSSLPQMKCGNSEMATAKSQFCWMKVFRRRRQLVLIYLPAIRFRLCMTFSAWSVCVSTCTSWRFSSSLRTTWAFASCSPECSRKIDVMIYNEACHLVSLFTSIQIISLMPRARLRTCSAYIQNSLVESDAATKRSKSITPDVWRAQRTFWSDRKEIRFRRQASGLEKIK